MIEFEKGFNVGDTLIFFKVSPHTNFKNIIPPLNITVMEIRNDVIGNNHNVESLKGKIGFGTHEIHLFREDERDKLMGKYYKALSSAGNSLPRKIRKAIKKYSDKHPEYII